MFELLITKSTAYAAKSGGGTIAGINEVNSLAEGAIAIFTNNNELVTNANASTIFENRSGFFFAVGGNGTSRITRLSEMVDRREVIQYTKKEYTAPVKQKITLGEGADASGDSGIGTPVAGEIASLRIIKTNLGTIAPLDTERYEYVVKTADTEAIILDALYAKVLANSKFVTPTKQGATVGLYFTAKEYGDTFEVVCDGILSECTVDYTTTGRGSVVVGYGIGTAADVAAIEEELSPSLGNTNKVHIAGKYYSVSPAVDPAGTYDMFHLVHQGVRQGATSRQQTVRKEIIIAIPDGGSQVTVFNAIMAYALAETNSVFNGIES